MKLGFMSTLQTVGTLTTKIAIVAAASIGGTALVSSSVFATLTASATNTTATAVTSGYMSLTQAQGVSTGTGGATSGGFTTAITALAPTDSVNRLVTLTNSSTLNAASMTVSVTDSSPTVLTTGSTGFTGLTAAITQCSQQYSQASAGALFTCGGTETIVKASSTILSMATPSALSVQSQTLSASGVAYLKITVTLPDTTENTLNGAVPGTGSVQSKTANLTWTIAATQRTAVTTNS